MKKIYLSAIIVVILLIFSSVSADDLEAVQQAGFLRFGAPLEYIPFVFEDENGNTNGMDIALLEEVCRRMGISLQKISFARDGLIDALTLGQVDVIGGGLSKTDSRAERIDFSRTYYNGEAQVIALTSLPKPEAVTMDSFRGMRIGVTKGSSFQEWILDHLVDHGYVPLENVYSFSDIADGMTALDHQDVDLVFTDQDLYEDRYRDSGKYQVFYTGFKTENYAFGFRKGSPLTQEINSHLSDMLRDGTAQSIANRFFSMDFDTDDQEIERPEATPAPIVTVVPRPSDCKNAMSYVEDVTVYDGQEFDPGAGFRKTWRVLNNGSCPWDENYYLDFVSGDSMGGNSVRIRGPVRPGETTDISVDFTAPYDYGSYKGYWQLHSPQGIGFGQTIWVAINVGSAPEYPTPDPDDGQRQIVPVIDYFYADPGSGMTGDPMTIYWSAADAVGVTISVDGYDIDNSSAAGSYLLRDQLTNVGSHTITLTAHSVTDDSSSSISYLTMGYTGFIGDPGQGGEDDGKPRLLGGQP